MPRGEACRLWRYDIGRAAILGETGAQRLTGLVPVGTGGERRQSGHRRRDGDTGGADRDLEGDEEGRADDAENGVAARLLLARAGASAKAQGCRQYQDTRPADP